MKFERIVYTAVVAVLLTACSGGEEQAAPTTVPVVDVATTAAPIVTTSTTVAPTTPPAEVPESLAFGSTKDLGRLFEVDGQQDLYLTPAGSIEGSVVDGTLVQATSARNSDGALWVRISETEGELQTLGWVLATDLEPTARSVEIRDANRLSEFRRAAPSIPGGQLDIVTTAGDSSSVVASLARGEVALHGGTSLLLSDGVTWVDVLDTKSRSRVGWVPSRFFAPLQSVQAQNDSGDNVGRRSDTSVSYGAPISLGTVVEGCNATQIAFTSNTSSLGTAIVFGQDVPVGRTVRGTTVWSASRGSSVYVAPGESVTFTFPSNEQQSWYFAALDADFQADTVGGASSPDGDVIATNVQRFDIAVGSCVSAAPVVEVDPESLIDSGNADEFDGLTGEERKAALAALLAAETAQEDAVTVDETADPDDEPVGISE